MQVGDRRVRTLTIKETAMRQDEYAELPCEGASWRLDPNYEADRLFTEFDPVSDPVETATYIDGISQRSAGWFRSI